MWRELRRRRAAEPAGPAGEEAMLERYVEHPSRVRDWLEARLRQAPWWCISFLVHVCALLVLWSWPVRSHADIETPITELPVSIVDKAEPEIQERQEEKPPQDPPVELEDFEIADVPDVMVRGEESEVEPLTPVEPAEGSPFENPELPRLDGLPPIIGPESMNPLAPPPGRLPPGDRKKLREAIEGKPVGREIITLVPPLIAALNWLAQAQERDGSWDARAWGGANSYKVGMGGLALLAFQGAGFTHKQGRYQRVILAGLDWLRNSQRDNGSFPWETFYEQGIATIAVCEAYALTGDPRVGRMAQRAISYIVAQQPEHGGFRYGGAVPRDQGDMSVTGWQIMAIKSAIMAGLDVPATAVERSLVFLRNSAREYGASAYLVGDQGPGSAAMTAVGLLCRVFLNDGRQYDHEIGQAAAYLGRRENPGLDAPPTGASKELVADLYYTYYSSLAMFQVGGEHWRAWQKMYLEPLKAAQVTATRDAAGKFVKGSWEPANDRWGARAGRVYTTAMGALCLEAPYRFLPMLQARP